MDRSRPEALRILGTSTLASLDAAGSADVLASRLEDATESLKIREAAGAALAASQKPQARTALVTALSSAPARLATALAASLAGNRDGAKELLDAIATGKASPRLLLERSVRVKLDALKRQEIHERIAKLTEGLPTADAALAQALDRRAQSYASSSHDLAAGARLYEKHCANCHQVAGKGSKIGPDLDGIGARGLERLLEDVLDPNRNVDPSFRTTNVLLKTGVSVSGLFLREEGAVLVLADALGKEERIENSRIESRDLSPLSPMPANWGDQIPEKDFNDLVAYLLSLRTKKD
jgi:putative heme-binding domain-containing protein